MQLSQTALPAHVVDPFSHLWPMGVGVGVVSFAIPAPSGKVLLDHLPVNCLCVVDTSFVLPRHQVPILPFFSLHSAPFL